MRCQAIYTCLVDDTFRVRFLAVRPMMNALLVHAFFQNVFVQASTHQIKQRLNKQVSFHIDTTEGFEEEMQEALKGLKEFYTEIDTRFNTPFPRKFFYSSMTHEKKRIKELCGLINELQDVSKGTLIMKPSKYKVVAREIQKLRKILRFLEEARCDITGYFHNLGVEQSKIDDAIFAMKGYLKDLNGYNMFLKDCPEKAKLPPRWTPEALHAVKEVFLIIRYIGNKKEERAENQSVSW